MTREDVINWLEYLSDEARSKANSLKPTNIEIACTMAINALKSKEPVKREPYDGFDYLCGRCNRVISRRYDYCPWCGSEVKR